MPSEGDAVEVDQEWRVPVIAGNDRAVGGEEYAAYIIAADTKEEAEEKATEKHRFIRLREDEETEPYEWGGQ